MVSAQKKLLLPVSLEVESLVKTTQFSQKSPRQVSNAKTRQCLGTTPMMLTKLDAKSSTFVSCVKRVVRFSKIRSCALTELFSTSNILYAIGGSTLIAALLKISTPSTS